MYFDVVSVFTKNAIRVYSTKLESLSCGYSPFFLNACAYILPARVTVASLAPPPLLRSPGPYDSSSEGSHLGHLKAQPNFSAAPSKGILKKSSSNPQLTKLEEEELNR